MLKVGIAGSGSGRVSVGDAATPTQPRETRLTVSYFSTTMGSASADSTSCHIGTVQILFLPFSKQYCMTYVHTAFYYVCYYQLRADWKSRKDMCGSHANDYNFK